MRITIERLLADIEAESVEPETVSDIGASRILKCDISDLDQLEVALNPERISGIRFWKKEAIESLIDTREVDE